MKVSIERLDELLDAEPPAALDALVLKRARVVLQRCARPSGDVESPARARAPDPPKPCPMLSPVRS